MTSIQTGISIYSPQVKAIDTSQMEKFRVSEADEDLYQRIVGGQEKFLKARYTQHADTANNPRHQPYATVTLNGKTVATVNNNGSVETSNALGAKLQELFADESSGSQGPLIAQVRAEKIAALLGGDVEKSSTAITQNQFNATARAKSTVDYQAMRDDPLYEQLQKTKQARTLFVAQQIAQDAGLPIEAPVEKVSLDTSHGEELLDIDAYFTPRGHAGTVDLDEIPLLIPSAKNIDTLSKHAAAKLQDLLKEYGIPAAPEKITYDTSGKIKFPADYAHADELNQALEDNVGLARELQTIAALTSHYVGMQAAIKGQGQGRNYAEIALNFTADGGLDVTANGKSYKGVSEKKETRDGFITQQTAPSHGDTYAKATDDSPDAVKEFLDFMDKTPAERYYEALLAEKGLTKEQLAALPPKERLKIEEEIEEAIKMRIAEDIGIDTSAKTPLELSESTPPTTELGA